MTKSNTLDEIRKQRAAIQREIQQRNRLDKSLAFIRNRLKNTEISFKISLGDLIIQAGLENETSAVLLGILNEAKQQLNGENADELRNAWQKLNSISLNGESPENASGDLIN